MTAKNYHELIKDRIYIGGADDVKDVMENEKADVIFDLRAEAPDNKSDYNRIHSPILDEGELQDESIRKSVGQIVEAYHEGKKVYFHCGGGSGRTGTVAVGTLLSLGKAKTIDEAEALAEEVRPKIKVKSEMRESLQRIYSNS